MVFAAGDGTTAVVCPSSGVNGGLGYIGDGEDIELMWEIMMPELYSVTQYIPKQHATSQAIKQSDIK